MNSSNRLFFFPVYGEFESKQHLAHVVESVDHELEAFLAPIKPGESTTELTRRQKNLFTYNYINMLCLHAIFKVNGHTGSGESWYSSPPFSDIPVDVNLLDDAKRFLYGKSNDIYCGEIFNCLITPRGNLVVLIQEGFLKLLSANKDQITKLIFDCARLMYESDVPIQDVQLHNLIGMCLKYNQHPEQLRIASINITSLSIQGVSQ